MTKKRKKKKNSLNKILTVRVNKAEYSRIKAMANMYAPQGKMSAWIRHCLMDYNPKILNKRASA